MGKKPYYPQTFTNPSIFQVNESRRTILHEDEIAAIRDSFEQLQVYSKQNENLHTPVIEAVPEELFRR